MGGFRKDIRTRASAGPCRHTPCANAGHSGVQSSPQGLWSRPEALYRRLRQGKDIYRINSLVDTNNVLSLACGLSCGIYDASRLGPYVVLRLGREQETYQGLGKGDLPLRNLPLLADDTGPFGSPVSDSARSCVTQDTTRALLVVYGFSGKTALAPVLDLASELFGRLAHAQVQLATII